ncbi:M14 family zinc carboxypeptidase [Mariniluteicoccus flavus]
MKRSALLLSTALCTALAVTQAPLAHAEPEGVTYGVPTRGLTSESQLDKEMQRLGRKGVETSVVGRSNEGRPLWLATVGHGPRTILITAQQHGNEPHGSEAALDLLRTLSTGNSPAQRRLRDAVTVHVMPRVNPDGAAHNWRQNFDPECAEAVRDCTPGRGIDPNRWHDPSVPDAAVPAPETRAVREVHRRVRPDLMLDVHGQLSYVTDGLEQITASVAWPNLRPDDLTPERRAATDTAKRASALIADAIHAERGVVTQFPLGDGGLLTARNAYAWLGTPTVLIEQRSDSGQRDLRTLVKEAHAAMLAVVTGAADGSLDDIDPARADALPERGLAVGPEKPHLPQACASTEPAGPGRIEVRTQSVLELVTAHETRVRAKDSGFAQPTREQACAFGDAYAALQRGEVERAAGQVAAYGYGVVRLHDPVTSRDHLALVEDAGGTSEYARGWGLFVHSPAGTSTATVAATYPKSATFSARAAAQFFDRADAQGLLVSGSHREATRADADSYEPANPTVASESALRRVSIAAVDPGEVALQILGTSEARSSLTSGTVPPSDLARRVDDRLDASGLPTCLYAEDACTDLGSTGSLLVQDARAEGAQALVVLPTYDIRRLKVNRERLAEALVGALG